MKFIILGFELASMRSYSDLYLPKSSGVSYSCSAGFRSVILYLIINAQTHRTAIQKLQRAALRPSPVRRPRFAIRPVRRLLRPRADAPARRRDDPHAVDHLHLDLVQPARPYHQPQNQIREANQPHPRPPQDQPRPPADPQHRRGQDNTLQQCLRQPQQHSERIRPLQLRPNSRRSIEYLVARTLTSRMVIRLIRRMRYQ